MKDNVKKPMTRKPLLYIILIVILLILYLNRDVVSEILSLVFIALFFSYVLYPFIVMLEKKVPRILALFLTYAVFTGLSMIVCIFLIPRFIAEIKGITKVLPTYVLIIKDYLYRFQEYLVDNEVPIEIQNFFNQYFSSLNKIGLIFMEKVVSSISKVLSKLGWVFIIPILSFYFLKDREYFAKQLLYLIPGKYRIKVKRFGSELSIVLNEFLRGQIYISSIVALLTSIGLFIANIRYALILGVLMGIFNIIPYFGPLLGAIPILIIAILQSKGSFLYAFIVIVAVQQLECSFIAPKIISDSVGIHPVYVMFALIVGGQILGVLGMLIAVPVMIIIKILVWSVYREFIYYS